MGHLEGDGQRELYQAAELLAVVPRHLVDEFLLAVLLNGVGVQLLVVQQVLQNGCRTGRVAVEKVVADYLLAVAVHVGGALVHVQDVALLVAHSDGHAFQAFKTFVHSCCLFGDNALKYWLQTPCHAQEGMVRCP